MIDFGTADLYIGVPSMPRDEFELYSTRLFDEWEAYVEKTLLLPDYFLSLDVEEGSVSARGKIAGGLAALYIGICNYGSFVSGLQTIRDQINWSSDFLAKKAAVPFKSSGIKPKVKKRGESLSRLQGLFVKVQQGEITVEQAMALSEALFGDETLAAPEFMQKLHESLEQAPLFPQQLPLGLETYEEEITLLSPPKGQVSRPSHPSFPKPNLPPSQQFRVEVWRESKKGKREVRVTKL
jgi:hypothetical protein